MQIIESLFGSTPLISMSVTVLVTLAITLIFKTSFTTNFAQGIISALGAYVVAQLMVSKDWPVWAALPIGVLVGVAVGVFIDVGLIRRGRNVNAIGKQIITMGLVTLLISVISLVFPIHTAETKPIIWNPFPDKFVGDWTLDSLVALGISAVIVALIFVLLFTSKWGLAVRATASNEFVAGMMGINTKVITAMSWGIAAGIGAIAACFAAWRPNILSSVFMTTFQINAFLACIVGGFGTFYGPLIAAVLLCLVSNFIGFIGAFVPEITVWRETLVYLICCIIVLIKPEGLFGKKSVKKV